MSAATVDAEIRHAAGKQDQAKPPSAELILSYRLCVSRAGAARSPNWEIACLWDGGFPNLAVMTAGMETATMVQVVVMEPTMTAEYEYRASSEALSPGRRAPNR